MKSPFVQNFRLELIDGASLCLLSDDHLTRRLGMKLGPALALRAALFKRTNGAELNVGVGAQQGSNSMCIHCPHCRETMLQYQQHFARINRQQQQQQQQQQQ